MSTPKRPGWYPAPTGDGEQWWNGLAWSESRRGAAGTAARAASDAAVHGYAKPSVHLPGSRPNLRANQLPSPPRFGTGKTPSINNTPALISVVLGIVAVFFIPLVGIPAIIFGAVGLGRARTQPSAASARPLAAIGITLGLVALVIGAFQLVIFIMTLSGAGITIG